MKKAIHYLAIVLSLIWAYKVSSIVIFDFDRLTQYGFGYLFGQVVLLLVFLALAFFTRNKQKA